MDVYRAADGAFWGVSPCPGPVCNSLVTGSVFLRRASFAATEYRHVDAEDMPPAIARRARPELDRSLTLLSTPERARTNGIYEGHMLDEWLGFDLVGRALGIDPASNRAVRLNLLGILTHDELGHRKAHFDLDNWRFGRGVMPTPHPRTLEIFRALPDEFVKKGARHVLRYSDTEIAEIVNGNFRYDDGAQSATRLGNETAELLAGRRDQMRSAVFGSRGGYETAPVPLTSAVPHDDPAIEYLRGASWPLHAALEFIKSQFPEVVFYIDADGTKETISPGSNKLAAINGYGYEIQDDPQFVRVYSELDDVSMILLSHYGATGLMKARPNADAALPPVIFGAAEETIINAGNPGAPPLYVYVFVPTEKNSPFIPDPFARGALRTDQPFKPLLVLPARASEARPDMYTLPEPLDRTHPYYWEKLLGRGSPPETTVFTPTLRPLRHVNGVPLNTVSAGELDEMRRKYAAMNAQVDQRHPYVPDYASMHRASAIMLELDEMIWLVQDPETGMWRLPAQSVERNGPRAKGAFEVAYRELGFAGPILGHVGDFNDERTSTKTRYFISRRHAGAPQALVVARMSIETALSVAYDPADVAALRTLRSMLTFPDWHQLARADEARLITQPGALHDYERGLTTHPYSKLAVGVHRVYRRHKIARAPKVFHGRISVDGHDVLYTGRRIETYVSLPGKPLVKKTAIVFERDDARPDEPTVIVQGGGPGASPAWFLGGGLGPIIVDEQGQVVTNNHSLLLGARLLFVDALGTGDALTDGEEEAYFNIDDDVEITAEFVRRCSEDDELIPYLKHSPIFAIGASYGVQRWGRAIENLIDNGMTAGGVIFVSGAMSYQLIDFEPESAISYACALVPYAATARHHLPEMKVRYPDEDAFLAEVERFAFNDYLPAIAKGTALEREDPERFSAIAQTLSDYIGLSPEFIKAKHLQTSQMDFCTMLVPGEVVAALDGRMKTRPVPDDAGNDPFAYVLDELVAKYQKALTKFLRNDVGYRPIEDLNRPYVVLAPLFARWGWGKNNNAAARVQDYLIRASQKNPKLRWLVGAGKYDVRTPATAHVYALNHLPPDVAERIEFHVYDGGHMFYMTDESARRQFIDDVLAFIKRQTDSRHEIAH
ncbi:hypothetical protein LJR230_000536 [Trinickia sp. LjRoot230]|uniref:hypothetical protein n=1 Tax=Trinickia sp. LjRoot230 TaxID=3342288 RepID=UPI003ECFBFC5